MYATDCVAMKDKCTFLSPCIMVHRNVLMERFVLARRVQNMCAITWGTHTNITNKSAQNER